MIEASGAVRLAVFQESRQEQAGHGGNSGMRSFLSLGGGPPLIELALVTRGPSLQSRSTVNWREPIGQAGSRQPWLFRSSGEQPHSTAAVGLRRVEGELIKSGPSYGPEWIGAASAPARHLTQRLGPVN